MRVKNKYGFDKVAVGLTFNNYKSKNMINIFESFVKKMNI